VPIILLTLNPFAKISPLSDLSNNMKGHISADSGASRTTLLSVSENASSLSHTVLFPYIYMYKYRYIQFYLYIHFCVLLFSVAVTVLYIQLN
jgi:hypothetical protein